MDNADEMLDLIETFYHCAPCSNDLPNDPDAGRIALQWAIDNWRAAVLAKGCEPIGDVPVAGFDHQLSYDITTIVVHGRVRPITEEARRNAILRAQTYETESGD